MRLAAIADRPGTYATTLAEAEARTTEQWQRVAAGGAEGLDQGIWFAVAVGGPEPGEVAGMVNAFRTADRTVTMTALWAVPDHRRVGVAEALVEVVLRWAITCDAAMLRTWVVERNEHARRFYEGLGFTVEGAPFPYEPDPRLLEVEMRRPVPATV